MSPARADRKIWRVIDLIHWAEEYFASRGFENPRREIEWLLRDLLNCSRIDLYLRFEEPLEKSQLETLRGWVKRRLNREPLQYITGTAEFYGLKFSVNPGVLIPRPETERVVDVAIHAAGNRESPRILDVGTGSGCIALAMAHELPQARVVALDIAEEALEVARLNAQNLDITNVRFIRMDFFKSTVDGPFDIVVSNPPYVTVDEMSSLMKDVVDYEPHHALTDNNDGLSFYRRLAEVAPELVRDGGCLVLEVGLGDHPRKAAALFKGKCFSEPELIADYNGDKRVLKVWVGQTRKS